jgi:hypothetical protein
VPSDGEMHQQIGDAAEGESHVKKAAGIKATDENFGALLIEALKEARAIARGEAEPAARVRRKKNPRHAASEPAPDEAGEDPERVS